MLLASVVGALGSLVVTGYGLDTGMTVVSSIAILIFVMQVFFRGLSFVAYSTSQVFCRRSGSCPIHNNLRSSPISRTLFILLSIYPKPSTCGVGCSRFVVGGALVELYAFFTSTFSESDV